MGCFNVACNISGISMYCDEAVLIPLVQVENINLSGSNLVSNNAQRIFFAPLTLPLFGNLDSYGRLEKIVRDENVKCIEKFFKVKINTFMEELCSYRDRKINVKNHIPAAKSEAMSGMWVHRGIWDVMISSCPGEFKDSDNYSIWNEGYLTPYVLGLIGFKFVKKDAKQERYNQLYTNEDFPGVKIWSDDRWIRIMIKGKEHTAYHLSQLIEIIEKETKRQFPAELKETLKKIPLQSVLFDAGIEPYMKDLKTVTPSWMRMTDERVEYFNLLPFQWEGGRKFFQALYGEKIKDMKQALVDFHTFNRNMYASNRFYCPTTNHYQHGNHYGHLMIAQETVRILEATIKEHDGE